MSEAVMSEMLAFNFVHKNVDGAGQEGGHDPFKNIWASRAHPRPNYGQKANTTMFVSLLNYYQIKPIHHAYLQIMHKLMKM